MADSQDDNVRLPPPTVEAGMNAPKRRVIAPEMFDLGMAKLPSQQPGAAEKPGDVIGPYHLVERIGEGGFGSVWRAEQVEPIHREVALKAIKAGMDSAEIIARFEAERQALAMMDHPNIAGVLDAGTTLGGRPYFVMELVKGVPITSYCDEKKLTIRQRIKLFIPVCQAVQHAHQKAILHRDLKPSNILVAEVDGKPVPKVIDFGIAKALGVTQEAALQDSLARTQEGKIVGTPQYMSPEQAGSMADIDTRSDIYTLGVILYELLTGVTPLGREDLKQAALDEVLRLVRESDPVRPSSRVVPVTEAVRNCSTVRGIEPGRLTRLLRGDLDWITLKALEKERARRYETANALAQDVQRYLSGEPVSAGPPSARYRLKKFVQRNKLQIGAAAATMLLLIAGVAVSSWQAIRASRAEELALARLEQVTREKQRADNEAATAIEVKAFLENDILSQAGSSRQADQGHAPNPNLTVREALDRAAERIGDRFRDRPTVEAEIRDTLGRSYADLGKPESALPHFQRARELWTQTQGAEHSRALGTGVNLATSLLDRGRPESAEQELRKVLAGQERSLGPENIETLQTRHNLAIALFAQGKHAEAERELRAVLAIEERVLGAQHSETLKSRNSLANAINSQGRHAEAEREFRELRDIREKALGAEHPDTLTTRNCLAIALQNLHRYAEAEKENRAVLAIREKVQGAEHPDTLKTRHNLAFTLQLQGKIVEAEQQYRSALPIQERVLGSADPLTLLGHSCLANALDALGRHVEAEHEHRLALDGREKILGPLHPQTLETRNSMGICLDAQAKYAEAEQMHRTNLALRTRVLGAEHSDTLCSRNNMATALNSLHRFEESENEHRINLAIRERTLGAEHPDTLSTCYNLSLALGNQHKLEEAIDLIKRAEAGQTKYFGPDHPETMRTRINRMRMEELFRAR